MAVGVSQRGAPEPIRMTEGFPTTYPRPHDVQTGFPLGYESCIVRSMENGTAQDAGTEAVADDQTRGKIDRALPRPIATRFGNHMVFSGSELQLIEVEHDGRFNCRGSYGDNFNSTVCTVLSLRLILEQ